MRLLMVEVTKAQGVLIPLGIGLTARGLRESEPQAFLQIKTAHSLGSLSVPCGRYSFPKQEQSWKGSSVLCEVKYMCGSYNLIPPSPL